MDVQSFIARELHSLLFLEEFVFARNRFSPALSSELELADAVVMLGDVLLIFQIKERSAADVGDANAERRWFQTKVLGKATKQVRDTLSYLREYDEIRVPNERGHVFNLAGSAYADIVKIVVYFASENLPDDCRNVRQYVSRSAGFIHIVEARDYLEISRTLRVPEEVVRYFRYRQTVLTRFAAECAGLPEPAIAGHFIGGDPNEPPTIASAELLYRLVQDDEEWDLAPLMRGIHDHLSTPGVGDEYYKILIEFAKMPRSMSREIKKRILLSIDKARKGEFERPYRITDPQTSCGFVFVPVDAEILARAGDNWPTIRERAVRNFTYLHKYDQHLSKCIGVLVAKVGDSFEILWCLIASEWVADPELQKRLDDNFPFRPVKEANVFGYYLLEG